MLGLQVGADGTLGLEPSKARELVRDVRRRAGAAVSAVPAGDAGRPNADEAARLAGRMVRQALEPDATQESARAATLLRRVVTDRAQLAELDHRIAREVAGAVTRDRSIRAFRELSPRVLRRRHGLPSLVAMRNRVGP
jgi:hypothetical protein